MAGIGFRLQKIMSGDTYISSLKAHFYSALISAGPWIMSVATLFGLNFFKPENIDHYEMIFFRTVLIYVFSLSLVAVGLFHFPLTRYIADKLYARDEEAILPVFNSAMLSVLLFQTVFGGVFFYFAGGSMIDRILALGIYLTISGIWLVMIFLTALRDYKSICLAFAAGSFISVFAAIGCGKTWGLSGYFLGYLLGQATTLILWSVRIFIEFRSSRLWDWDILRFLFLQKRLVAMGFLYNLALWIDKFIFWLSEYGLSVTPLMRICLSYDNAAFFAYLTIIPALSLFLMEIETDFYTHYRRYFSKILHKAPLRDIERQRQNIARSLRSSAVFLIRYQGVVSLFAIVFAPELTKMLYMPATQIPIFRVMIIGAFLHSLFLMTFIIILYFDFQKMALTLAFMYAALNALLSWASTFLPPAFHGYGYMYASLISLAAAYFWLDRRIKHLEYHTFAPQPVGA